MVTRYIRVILLYGYISPVVVFSDTIQVIQVEHYTGVSLSHLTPGVEQQIGRELHGVVIMVSVHHTRVQGLIPSAGK